jgi:hypothetical protein
MPVYEGIYMTVCKHCKAEILVTNGKGDIGRWPNDLVVSCLDAKLPLDCDEAKPVVAAGNYKAWEDGPWMDEEPEWEEM